MKKIRVCKYCGREDELFVFDSGKVLNVCTEHKYLYNKDRQENKKRHKKCKYCNESGLEKLIHINNKILSCCNAHYEQYKIDKQNKAKQTFNINWGVDNPSQSIIIQEKKKATDLEKYGVEYHITNKDVLKKSLETKRELYGDATFTNSEKMWKTKEDRYGDRTYCNPEKAIETNLEKYGVIHPYQLIEYQEKRKKTCNKNLGVDFPAQSSMCMDKIKATKQERYGDKNYNNRKSAKIMYKEKTGYNNPMQNPDVQKKNAMATLKSFRLKYYENTELTYQTKPEFEFIEHCIKNNIEIENGDNISYIFEGREHYYFCDFKIKENGKWRLIEIKGKHKWYYEDLISGKLLAKAKAALIYSKINDYLPYKMVFNL